VTGTATTTSPKRSSGCLGLLGFAVLAFAAFGGAAIAQSVTAYHGSANRSGLYVTPALTWAKAAGVHLDRSFRASVTGNVYAQPLYWLPPGATVGDIIVVTESNDVYALNANTGAPVWHRSLGVPVPGNPPLPCGNIAPVGVTGTPAIDPTTGRLYLDAMISEAGVPHHVVYGLSLLNGGTVRGWPIDVKQGLMALGKNFNTSPQGERSALTIAGGKLYFPFGGLDGDCGSYRGWAVEFDLAPTPKLTAGWATRASGGGAWGQSGIAYDGTSLFLTTGNTFTNSATGNCENPGIAWGEGEGVIRLTPNLVHSTAVADYFAPRDWQCLDASDLDLGGTAAIPIDVPSVNGTVPRVLALGKDGKAYLLNRARLGGIGGQLAVAAVSTDRIRTAMATFNTPKAAVVAFEGQGAACPAGQSGNLTALDITARNTISTRWCQSFDGAGAPIVTTTNGRIDAIVWVVGAEGDNALHGFRGTDGAPLYNGTFSMSGLHHFQTILVAAGRFYVAGDGGVYAFSF
jgi:hypothetical protein